MNQLDRNFAWTRKVPREWTEDLNRLNVGENVSSLHLVWQAGWPWAPVCRWEVYEVLPGKSVERIINQEELVGIFDSLTRGLWEACKGPDPRSVGSWVNSKNVPAHMGGKKWRSKSPLSQTAWRLHQQTGGLPFRTWIIEGDKGGHAWQLGNLEKMCLSAMGADADDIQKMVEAWPNPGSLPYAEYDQRVFNALGERNQLAAWHNAIRWDDRLDREHAKDFLTTEDKARHREMMGRLVKYIDRQVSAIVSDIPRKLLPARSDLNEAAQGAPVDVDAEMEQLIQEG